MKRVEWWRKYGFAALLLMHSLAKAAKEDRDINELSGKMIRTFYDENKTRQFCIVPLEAALADYENIVDSRTRTGAPALERELNTTVKRLGEEHARPVASFLP